jgi:MFS family permease
VAFAFSLQLVPPLIPSIIEEFGVTHAEAGLLMSIVLAPGIFLSLPAGLLVERFGARRIGLASLVCVVLGSLVPATATSFGMMLTGRFVLGLGGSFIIPTTSAIVAQWFSREELGKAMGIYGVNMPFATIVAFPSASLFMLAYGWRVPFYVSLGVGIAATVVFVAAGKEGRHADGQRVSARQAIGNTEIWKVGLVWLFFNAAALSFTTWAPKLFETFKGMPEVNASLWASLLMWAAILLVPVFGWVSDRTGRRRPFAVLGSLLMVLAFVSLAYSPDLALFASIVALGVAAAMVPPIASALPAEVLGPSLASVGFGITGICLNLGAATAQPLVGLILDLTNSYVLCLLGLAALSAFGAIAAYSLKTN